MLKFIQKPMPRPAAKPPKRARKPVPQPEPVTVEPMWLVKAIGATILAALLCAYLALCLLFYQGQWQLVLHPARTEAAPQSIGGAPFEVIHFGPDASAIPQRTGWWIPAGPGNRYGSAAVLFLPGGDGSLQDSIPTLAALHGMGVNVFAFDYRGYGQSAKTHPSQERMTTDVESAWNYLTGSRAIAGTKIVVYGTGVGASLAVHLAAEHATIPGIVLDAPRGDLLDVARSDPRSHLVPVGQLFHERFPLTEPLQSLRTPKLLLSQPAVPKKIRNAFDSAAVPKTAAEIQSPSGDTYRAIVTKFLDTCLSVTQAHNK